MKVYCKRTVFNTVGGLNAYEDTLIFSKDKYYNSREPLEFESSAGIYLWIKCEIGEMVPVTQKYFKKYFILVEDLRNNKINEILN